MILHAKVAIARASSRFKDEIIHVLIKVISIELGLILSSIILSL